MTETDAKQLEKFFEKSKEAFSRLFELAKSREEVQYAMALGPEMRGSQVAGWNTAHEASRTLEDYLKLLEIAPADTSIRVRVGLSLYCHLSEASGFYEVPKNMMRVASGEDYNLSPFQGLSEHRKATGELIAPNATKIMKDLLGHASELQLNDFCDVIMDVFDFDLRNGYAHADYVIWDDGIRLPRRNGGQPKTVPFDVFSLRVNKAIAFFVSLQDAVAAAMQAYVTPQRTQGRMNSSSPVMPAIISYTDEGFQIKMGFGI